VDWQCGFAKFRPEKYDFDLYNKGFFFSSKKKPKNPNSPELEEFFLNK